MTTKITQSPIEIICQECSQRQEVFWDSKLQSYDNCWYCHIDQTFFTKVGA
jgi:hypothetical protein